MKLPQIVPRLSRATLGMTTGPETRDTVPYDLLAGSWREVYALAPPRVPTVRMMKQKQNFGKS